MKLPSSVDVVVSSPDFVSVPPPEVVQEQVPDQSSPVLSSRPPPLNRPTPNLPVVIEKKTFTKGMKVFLTLVFFVALLVFGSIGGRQLIVKTLPGLRGSYSAVGLSVLPEWDGLIFDEVKSELKYDSGTMRLFVDGTIRNASDDTKRLPDIKARALGADGSVIQSWLIDAPAEVIEPWGMISFHSDVATPMERTIEDVYLEFTSRREKKNANE
ncbi:MAG: hypothetical protein WC464_00570 [Bdellovibrionales bacterium]